MLSDPFHTGGWTGKSPYFFDFWYWRTNSVRSKNKVEAFSGENPYSKLGLLASCKTRTCQKSGFYPEFEDSREVQLGSLAAIGFLLQIRDLLGDIDRFERSVRFKFSRSVWFKFFLETEKVQIQMFLGEKKPNLIWQLLLIKSGLLRVPNFRCGTGLSRNYRRYIEIFADVTGNW